jgi:Bacterial regulatory proteins, tetR family
VSQAVTWGALHAERADAARNRRHLLATAREMLAEQGAAKLTMDALAERAGLGKGTVPPVSHPGGDLPGAAG